MEETNMSGRSQNRRPDYRPYVENKSSPEFNKFLAEVKVKAVPEDKRTYFEVDNPEQGKNLADTAKKYNIKVTYPGDSNNFSVSGDSPAFKAGQELARTESGLDTDDLDSKAKEAGYEGEDLTNFKFGYNSVDKKADNFSSRDDIFTVYDTETKLRKVDSKGRPVEFKKVSEAKKWAEDNGGEVASLLFYVDRIQPKMRKEFSNLASTEVHNMESEKQVIEDLVAEDLAAGIKDGSEEFSAACTLYSKKYGVNFCEKYKKVFSERYKKDNFSEDTDEKFNLITEVLEKVVSSIEELRADLDKIQKPEPTVSTDPTTTEEPTDDKNMSSEKYVVVNTKTGKKVFTGTLKECDDWRLAKSDKSEKVPTYVTQSESSYKNENFADTNVGADNDESKDDDKVKGTKDKPNTKVDEPTSTEGTKSKAYYDGQSTAKTDSKKEEFGKEGRAEELATKFGYKKDSKEFSEFVEGYKTAPKDDKQSDEEADRELSTNFSHDEAAARYSELKSYFTSTDF
jgi:putative sterol carrier protein